MLLAGGLSMTATGSLMEVNINIMPTELKWSKMNDPSLNIHIVFAFGKSEPLGIFIDEFEVEAFIEEHRKTNNVEYVVLECDSTPWSVK